MAHEFSLTGDSNVSYFAAASMGRSICIGTSTVRATLLAALLVLPASGTGTLLHFTLVEHTVCPEHGSLTHVIRAPHGEGPAAPFNSLSEGNPAAAGHGHQHCFSMCVAQAADPTLPVVVDVSSPLALRVHGPVTLDIPSVSVLQVAPKNSPPS